MTNQSTYTLIKTCLGNPLSLEVTTPKQCVYCKHLKDPNLRHPKYPKGGGYCYFQSETSFDNTCDEWKPNEMVRFWLSKGYMQNNPDGWPKKPWYALFDDGADGLAATR